jgi:putative addiction module CopG family antidote
MTKTVSCYIGKHFEDFIERLIANGRYSTAGEVIRDGLWMIEEREQRREAKLEWLRAEIQKASTADQRGKSTSESGSRISSGGAGSAWQPGSSLTICNLTLAQPRSPDRRDGSFRRGR